MLDKKDGNTEIKETMKYLRLRIVAFMMILVSNTLLNLLI